MASEKEKLDTQTILEAHQKWLDSGGQQGQRANLQEADLERAHLEGADLRRAHLQGANLRGANLRGANL